MIIQPDPILAELLARHDRDRTLRKAEEYELHRAVREAREQARAQRRAERRARKIRRSRPRTGHRRRIPRRVGAILRQV